MFFKFFKLYKCYQIAQNIKYWPKDINSKNSNFNLDIPTKNNDLDNDSDKNKENDSQINITEAETRYSWKLWMELIETCKREALDPKRNESTL